jgi:hypothetical protein
MPAEAGQRIAKHAFKTSTAEELTAARGPALAMANKATREEAVRQRSLQYRNDIQNLLIAQDHQRISDLCRELAAARVTIRPEHMDGLMDFAAKKPGRLAALLCTLKEAGMQSKVSPEKFASLLTQAAIHEDEALLDALIGPPEDAW